MGHRTSHISIGALALLFLLVLVPAASADLQVCATGSDAGQCKSPAGLAVDSSNGRLYAADTGNRRIDVFDSSGAFLFAFGWKVDATTPEEKLQVCTVATGCQGGSPGSGAGQFSAFGGPGHIAVDSNSHSVYATDIQNHRVQKFDSEGHFLWMAGGEVNQTDHTNLCTKADLEFGDTCGAGIAGAEGQPGAEGQFIGFIALSLAVGPGGVLYVADSQGSEANRFKTRIQKFESSGTNIGPQLVLPDVVGRVAAVDVDSSTGDMYVSTEGFTAERVVAKYHPDGTPYGFPFPLHPDGTALALERDDAGNLFFTGLDSSAGAVFEYDPTGAQLRTIYGSGPLTGGGRGLAAFHTATGDLFVSQPDGVFQVPLPPPGPLTLPGSTEATEIGNSKATLKARVNPEGQATEFAFQYVDDATFQADQPNGFENAQQTPFEAIPGPGGSSFELQNVAKKLPVETLAPETGYHLRVVARNADAPAGNPGPEGTPFTTLGPPEVLDTWATDVGSDSARLHAEVDPLLLATSGYFQYVDDATYKADVEAFGPGHGFDHATSSPDVGGGSAPLDFGNGEGGVERSALANPLSPGTTYRYRVVIEDSFAHQVLGPERLLRTFALAGANDTDCPNQAFRIGASAVLPDCRAYEMVSPLDKNNGDIISRVNLTGYPTDLNQSSTDGSGFTYSSYRAFADPQSAPYTNQLLATRDPEAGWQSEAIAPPRGRQFRFELENEYKAFSSDLSQAWLRQEGEPTLDPCAPPGFTGLYRRDNATGAYRALSCAQPSLDPKVFMPELEGFSVDGSHAVFRINDPLAVSEGPQPSGASAGSPLRPIYQVYLASGNGELRLVNVLPSGEASEKDSSAGTALDSIEANHNRFEIVEGAVSEDGNRVFWSAGAGAGQIYLRLNADREQSASGACDEAGKACTIAVSESVTPDAAQFQIADPPGAKALFSVTAGPLKDNLYEFDVASEEAQLIAEGVQGHILGASEDLSRVYFVSSKASAQAQAEGALEGKPNIYLHEEGATRFIATLSTAGPGSPYSDLANLFGSPTATSPIERTARVSADGSGLAFMSNSGDLAEAAAGYDNTDAANGQPDFEVYLYDAEADGGAGALRCVSCNPSGERPRGREINMGSNGNVGPYGAATVPRPQTQLYQSRYLSDDGKRVFFNSFEALVIADTNGKQDVYQWEAPGAGKCTTDSPSYIPTSEGCLSLISSGQSSEDSKFLDASASGSDVFFTTAEDLLPQDFGLVDVYDARANGGFPPPPPPSPACEGDACQSPAIPPNDPTPASSSFEGAGDPKPRKSSRRCRAGQRQVRKAGKSRCVKAQKKSKRNRKHSNRGRAGR